ncbi:MAG: helix-turn-helix transcriptional regulator [Blautia marasmi]
MISANLNTLRKQRGYSQEEVAEKIGVSRQAVAKWESGRRCRIWIIPWRLPSCMG